MSFKTSKCRSCDADIVWLKTTVGKNIPVDVDSLEVGDDESTVFNFKVHQSHFATCPNADQHRKSR